MPSHLNLPLLNWRATSRQPMSSGLCCLPSDASELLDAGLHLQTVADVTGRNS
jgi:hypothetical protein